jgi:hypothetical protein
MNALAAIRRALRSNRHWVSARRIQREGPLAAFKRWHLWSRILDTGAVTSSVADERSLVEIHILCSERDYLCAIWALKSLYRFAEVTCPLAIHLQGWCPPRVGRRLRQHFPQARVITHSAADVLVDAKLGARQLHRLRELRRRSPFMLKLTDFVLFCRASRLLLLDSDVLFFAPPRHLLEGVHFPCNTALFQRDLESTYNIGAHTALERFGIRLTPAINTGIGVVPRDAIDLERCEYFLSDPEVARANGFIEQTLYALCVSERLAVNYLPEDYLVSLQPRADINMLTARHYAGPSRPLLTGEGLPALIRQGFLRERLSQA